MVKALNYGRLGNVFFQIATCIGFSKKHGLDFSVQNTTNNNYWNPLYLQFLVNPEWDESKELIIIKEPSFNFSEIPFDENWREKNILLDGYWQSPKYFDFCREEILEKFNAPNCTHPDVCSVHGRFGDYLTIEGKHIIMDEPYLINAMAIIMAKTGVRRFKVFSDDLNYFKTNFGHLYNFEYSENSNELEDVIEIASCGSQINSSSTFSWWGAWLSRNPDKVVVTPEWWFREGWQDANTKDIIPDNWVKV